VKPRSTSVLTPASRTGGRRQRQQKRRRWALVIAAVIVVGIVTALAVVSLGGKKTADSTTTSTLRTLASSTTTLPAAATTSTAVVPSNGAGIYTAPLSGKDEIPPVSTPASGTLTLTVAENGASVKYVLRVATITNLTVARLHEGKAGANGPTIITLYGGPPKAGKFSGVLAQGTFTAADLQGPLQGKKVADIVALIKGGRVYLNVGTTAHINGEIRGQVK
jgi:hypothetical protein